MSSQSALLEAAIIAIREAQANKGRISSRTYHLLDAAVEAAKSGATTFARTERFHRALMPTSTPTMSMLRIADRDEYESMAQAFGRHGAHAMCVGVNGDVAYTAYLDGDHTYDVIWVDRDRVLAWLSAHGYAIL